MSYIRSVLNDMNCFARHYSDYSSNLLPYYRHQRSRSSPLLSGFNNGDDLTESFVYLNAASINDNDSNNNIYYPSIITQQQGSVYKNFLRFELFFLS